MSYNDNYKIEVKEKYGETKEYTEYVKKTKNYSSSKWDAVNAGLNEIFYQFSIYLKSDISFDSLEVQELVIKLQKYITDNYYACTDDILFGLSNMYVNDERFKNNIDKHLEGTAFYVMNAIKFKVKKQQYICRVCYNIIGKEVKKENEKKFKISYK